MSPFVGMYINGQGNKFIDSHCRASVECSDFEAQCQESRPKVNNESNRSGSWDDPTVRSGRIGVIFPQSSHGALLLA